MDIQEFDRRKCEKMRAERIRKRQREREEYLQARRIVEEYERKYK